MIQIKGEFIAFGGRALDTAERHGDIASGNGGNGRSPCNGEISGIWRCSRWRGGRQCVWSKIGILTPILTKEACSLVRFDQRANTGATGIEANWHKANAAIEGGLIEGLQEMRLYLRQYQYRNIAVCEQRTPVERRFWGKLNALVGRRPAQ